MKESITVEFEPTGHSVNVRVSEYNIDSISPEIVIQALYDLARNEERSWERWCAKVDMEEDLQKRRN